MKLRAFVILPACLLVSAAVVLADSTVSSAPSSGSTAAPANSAISRPQGTPVSATNINQNSSLLLGKEVTMQGKVDRVLGNGAFIVNDLHASNDASNRILVLSTLPPVVTPDGKQQAGTVAPNFKEGDVISLQGRVEQLNISSEVDSFSPKTNTEAMNAQTETVPVIVAQPSSLRKSAD